MPKVKPPNPESYLCTPVKIQDETFFINGFSPKVKKISSFSLLLENKVSLDTFKSDGVWIHHFITTVVLSVCAIGHQAHSASYAAVWLREAWNHGRSLELRGDELVSRGPLRAPSAVQEGQSDIVRMGYGCARSHIAGRSRV